jgi:hypothetical protein
MITGERRDWHWLRRRRNWRTAIHEAGHTTLAIIEGRPFEDIIIKRDENTNGMTRSLSLRHSDDECVRILLAGIMAARLARHRWDTGLFDTAWDDLGFVADFCRNHEAGERLLRWNVTATERYLREHWSPLLGVAMTLSHARRISFAEVRQEFKEWKGRPSEAEPPGVLGPRGWVPLIEQINWRMKYPNGLEDVAREFRFQGFNETE